MNKKSISTIIDKMITKSSLTKKTNEFLKILKPIPKQLTAVKKLAKKQAKNEKHIMKDMEKLFNENHQLKQQKREQKEKLAKLRKEKQNVVTQLRSEIKDNKYKNKETKQQLKEQKKQILSQIQENPIFIKNKEKLIIKKKKINAVKLIQKNWKNILQNRKQYSVRMILYRSHSLSDAELYKGVEFGNIEAVKEMYRRKKVKFFLKNIAVYDPRDNKYSTEKRFFIQFKHSSFISVKFTDKEFELYNERYTYRDLVIVDDKFTQTKLNTTGRLKKNEQKKLFNNTIIEWDNLLVDCRQDVNFDDAYIRFFPYLHAIYIYNAIANNDTSEPFENILDVNNYQALDNNAICYKHIDYTLNKDALNFADIFTFTEANKKIETDLKANSCYFNIIISTYKESIESVMRNGKRAYRDLTPEYLCQIMEIENKEQDLGLSIRSSVKFFQKFHLGLVVVNIYDDVIFKYTPEVKYNCINPHTLYVLVYNSHCYRLNSNENSFVHKLNLKNVVDEEKKHMKI